MDALRCGCGAAALEAGGCGGWGGQGPIGSLELGSLEQLSGSSLFATFAFESHGTARAESGGGPMETLAGMEEAGLGAVAGHYVAGPSGGPAWTPLLGESSELFKAIVEDDPALDGLVPAGHAVDAPLLLLFWGGAPGLSGDKPAVAVKQRTSLQVAAFQGSVATTQRLLQMGADPTLEIEGLNAIGVSGARWGYWGTEWHWTHERATSVPWGLGATPPPRAPLRAAAAVARRGRRAPLSHAPCCDRAPRRQRHHCTDGRTVPLTAHSTRSRAAPPTRPRWSRCSRTPARWACRGRRPLPLQRRTRPRSATASPPCPTRCALSGGRVPIGGLWGPSLPQDRRLVGRGPPV